MNGLNIPGFTAEIACNLISRNSYRSVTSHYKQSTAEFIPQLRILNTPFYCSGDGDCQWIYDPGVWGLGNDPEGSSINPGIGDVKSRACKVRCRKMKRGEERTACLDACEEPMGPE